MPCGAERCDSSSGRMGNPDLGPGLGSSIGEGFLIIVTGVLGLVLGVLELPLLRHLKFQPRGRRQCDKTVQGRRIPSSATRVRTKGQEGKRGWVGCVRRLRARVKTGLSAHRVEMGMGMVMGLRGKGKNSPATKILLLTNPWAVMRVGGSWSSSCVSDASHAPFPLSRSFPTTSSSKQPPPKTDGRARPLHGVALPLRDRLWPCSKKHQQQHPAAPSRSKGRKIMSARGRSFKHTHHTDTDCPVRPSTDPRGFIPDGASHHRHCNPCSCLPLLRTLSAACLSVV